MYNFLVNDALVQGSIDKMYSLYTDAQPKVGWHRLSDDQKSTIEANAMAEAGSDGWMKMTHKQRTDAMLALYMSDTENQRLDSAVAMNYLTEAGLVKGGKWSPDEIEAYYKRDDVSELRKKQLTNHLRWGYSFGYGLNNLIPDGEGDFERDENGDYKRVYQPENKDSLDWTLKEMGVPEEYLTEESIEDWRATQKEIGIGKYETRTVEEKAKDDFWEKNTIKNVKTAKVEDIRTAMGNLKDEWKKEGSAMISTGEDRKEYKRLWKIYQAELSSIDKPGSKRDKEKYQEIFNSYKPRKQNRIMDKFGSFDSWYSSKVSSRISAEDYRDFERYTKGIN